MEWLPAWLGSRYASLFAEFGSSPFTSDGAAPLIGGGSTARVALSKLAAAGYLTRRRLGRRVEYACADPYELAVPDPPVPQRELRAPLRRTVAGLWKLLGDDLLAVVLFGSAARGRAGPESDLDLLVVARNFSRRYGERVEALLPAKAGFQGPPVQFYPLRPEEVGEMRPLFLDILHEGRALFERGGFATRWMERMRSRLARAGCRRVELSDGTWFWDLKPDYRPGEVVEL